MDNSSTATAKFEQADEDILTHTVSDEALETAAGGEMASTLIPCVCASVCC